MADVYDINDLNKRLIRQLRGSFELDQDRWCEYWRTKILFLTSFDDDFLHPDFFRGIIQRRLKTVLKALPINTKVPKSKADGKLKASRAERLILIVLKAQNKTRLRLTT